MTSRSIAFALLVSSTVSLSATAAIADPLPTDLRVAPGLSGGVSVTKAPDPVAQLSTAYTGMQELWNDCYSVKNTCGDLLTEGKNAPARKKWVDYYVSTLKQSLDDMQALYKQTNFPSDLQPTVSSQYASVGTAINDLQASLDKLTAETSKVKDPTDDKYPPNFWEPAKSVQKSAEALDGSLVSILSSLDTSHDNALLTAEQQTAASAAGSTGAGGNSGSSSVSLQGGATVTTNLDAGFNGIVSATTKVRDGCMQLFGELERFNLLYGKAPANPTTNMFYGGGFTKEQILSQYKYMPNFVFTTAPYVMLNSYRLPPRQKMLATYTKQIGQMLNMMDGELLNIQTDLPADKKDALAGPWEAVKQQYVDARNQYMALYNLVQNANDKRLSANILEDQTSFGAPALAIYQDMDKLHSAVDDFKNIAK